MKTVDFHRIETYVCLTVPSTCKCDEDSDHRDERLWKKSKAKRIRRIVHHLEVNLHSARVAPAKLEAQLNVLGKCDNLLPHPHERAIRRHQLRVDVPFVTMAVST